MDRRLDHRLTFIYKGNVISFLLRNVISSDVSSLVNDVTLYVWTMNRFIHLIFFKHPNGRY